MASGHEADNAGGRGTRKQDPECAGPGVPADFGSGTNRVQRLGCQRLAAQVTAVWLVFLAVAATGGALVLFYALIRRVGAIRANLAGYLAPAFAITYGRAFLSEPIHTLTTAGLALILIGSYLAAA